MLLVLVLVLCGCSGLCVLCLCWKAAAMRDPLPPVVVALGLRRGCRGRPGDEAAEEAAEGGSEYRAMPPESGVMGD